MIKIKQNIPIQDTILKALKDEQDLVKILSNFVQDIESLSISKDFNDMCSMINLAIDEIQSAYKGSQLILLIAPMCFFGSHSSLPDELNEVLMKSRASVCQTMCKVLGINTQYSLSFLYQHEIAYDGEKILHIGLIDRDTEKFITESAYSLKKDA